MQTALSLQQMIANPLAEAVSRNAGTVFFWPGESPRGLIASETKDGLASRYRRVDLGEVVSPADFAQAMAVLGPGITTVETGQGARWEVKPASGVMTFTRVASR